MHHNTHVVSQPAQNWQHKTRSTLTTHATLVGAAFGPALLQKMLICVRGQREQERVSGELLRSRYLREGVAATSGFSSARGTAAVLVLRILGAQVRAFLFGTLEAR